MKIVLLPVFIGVLICGGCGQTGPLMLPSDSDKAKPEKTTSK